MFLSPFVFPLCHILCNCAPRVFLYAASLPGLFKPFLHIARFMGIFTAAKERPQSRRGRFFYIS
jgi:hypothetical protein